MPDSIEVRLSGQVKPENHAEVQRIWDDLVSQYAHSNPMLDTFELTINGEDLEGVAYGAISIGTEGLFIQGFQKMGELMVDGALEVHWVRDDETVFYGPGGKAAEVRHRLGSVKHNLATIASGLDESARAVLIADLAKELGVKISFAGAANQGSRHAPVGDPSL